MKPRVGISFAAVLFLFAGSLGASNVDGVHKAAHGAETDTFSTKPSSMRGGAAEVIVAPDAPTGVIIGQPIVSTPANGTTLTCNGTPLSTQTTQVVLRNLSSEAATGATCSTAGAAFAIQQPPTGTIDAGGFSPVVVACNVPALGAPAVTGTLNCSVENSVFVFPLASLAQPAAASIAVPSTSLWARIGMVGLLATLGSLAIGLRRR